jgi:tetratricopeptide (TPR) repeat protein
VLISLAVYAALIIYAAYNIKRKDIIAFGILFYLITISIVSNLLIIIGTVMADRLLYLPSLGFCLVIAVLLGKLFKAAEINIKMTGIKDFMKMNAKPLAAALVLFVLYSFKTIDRLPVWRDNNTLYSSGVVDAPNSSRTHYLMGIELKNIIGQDEPDSLKRIAIYKHAIGEFKQAVALYPSSFDAYRDMGRAYDEIGDTADALRSYDMALKINPNDSKTLNNKSTLLFARRDYAAALELLKQAVYLDPRYADGLRNLGSCYGMMGDYDDALTYLFKSLDFENDKQKDAGTYRMIGMTYLYMGDKQKSDEYIALSKQNATGGN